MPPIVKMKDCRNWPEFEACLPLFQQGARKFGYDVEQQFNFVISYSPTGGSSNQMHRSSIYGTQDASQKLAALARRMGYEAHADLFWDRADNDWALVITGIADPAASTA